MPCPYINICFVEVSKEHFESYCTSNWNWRSCRYLDKIRPRKLPRDWLKEGER